MYTYVDFVYYMLKRINSLKLIEFSLDFAVWKWVFHAKNVFRWISDNLCAMPWPSRSTANEQRGCAAGLQRLFSYSVLQSYVYYFMNDIFNALKC